MQILPALTKAFRQRLVAQGVRADRLTRNKQRRLHEAEKFDAIVVGAGPAGNACAYTLRSAA